MGEQDIDRSSASSRRAARAKPSGPCRGLIDLSAIRFITVRKLCLQKCHVISDLL